MQKGNVLIIFGIFIAIFIVIFLLVILLFMTHVNNILYNIKLDIYSMAKLGIISVNKNVANSGTFSYDAKTYKKELEELLKSNYNLDDTMSNTEKLISKVSIEDCKIYRNGQTDDFTKQKCKDTILHVVLNVKIRPIVLRDYLENIFTFQIHEDVNMNMIKI